MRFAMDPREFLFFVRRRLSLILITMLVALGIGLGYTVQSSRETQGATLFLTLGMVIPKNVPLGAFVANQNQTVVDQFTETVMGWLRNPALLKRIEERTGFSLNLGIRKQEKQNVIVTFTIPEGADVSATAQAVVDVARGEIDAYNDVTDAGFILALYSVTPFAVTPAWGVNAAVGLGLGFVLGILIAAFSDYFRRRVSFSFQVEQIAGKSPLLVLSPRLNESALQGFLSLYLDRQPSSVMLVGVGETGFHAGLLNHRSAAWVAYPAPVAVPFVAVVRLGETSEDQLRELRLLCGEPFDYILIV